MILRIEIQPIIKNIQRFRATNRRHTVLIGNLLYFGLCFLLVLVCLFCQTKRRNLNQLFLRKSFQSLLHIGILLLFIELFVESVNFVHVVLNKLVLTVVLQIVTVVLRVLLTTFRGVDKLTHRLQIQIRHMLQLYVCICQKLNVAYALLSLV